MNTDRAIFTSAIVTVTSTVGASMLPSKYGGKGELPSPRLLIGTSLTFMGLSIMGDLAPQVATPIAAAVALTALTYYGLPLLDNYFNQKHNVFGGTATPVGSAPTKADHLASLPHLSQTPPSPTQ